MKSWVGRRRLYGLGLGAGFLGAGLLWVGGQIFWLAVPFGLALMLVFMIAMGRAARKL